MVKEPSVFEPFRFDYMLLYLQIGFSFVRAAVACAILERTSGFETSTETIAPRYLKLVTLPSFCLFTLISLWMPLALFVINLVFSALISIFITKTCLYNFDPLKPHFYIVKLGFTGVYIIFLISAQKHRLWYSLEPPRRGGSNKYHNLCFDQKYVKYRNFLSENFHFLVVKFSVYLNRRVFVMYTVCRFCRDCQLEILVPTLPQLGHLCHRQIADR